MDTRNRLPGKTAGGVKGIVVDRLNFRTIARKQACR
jgi:hypothetical protein